MNVKQNVERNTIRLTLELARLLVLDPEDLLDLPTVLEELSRVVIVSCPRHVADKHLHTTESEMEMGVSDLK